MIVSEQVCQEQKRHPERREEVCPDHFGRWELGWKQPQIPPDATEESANGVFYSSLPPSHQDSVLPTADLGSDCLEQDMGLTESREAKGKQAGTIGHQKDSRGRVTGIVAIGHLSQQDFLPALPLRAPPLGLRDWQEAPDI